MWDEALNEMGRGRCLDTIDLFVERLKNLEAEVGIYSGVEELVGALVRLIKTSSKPVIIVGERTEYRKEILNRLSPFNVKLLEIDPETNIDVYDSEISIGFPELAIASTGTVVYSATSGIEEASVFAPEKHVSIVSKSRLVTTFGDAMQRLEKIVKNGRSIFLVSGPSSTADIEGEIVRGVHGPRMFTVFILKNY